MRPHVVEERTSALGVDAVASRSWSKEEDFVSKCEALEIMIQVYGSSLQDDEIRRVHTPLPVVTS